MPVPWAWSRNRECVLLHLVVFIGVATVVGVAIVVSASGDTVRGMGVWERDLGSLLRPLESEIAFSEYDLLYQY